MNTVTNKAAIVLCFIFVMIAGYGWTTASFPVIWEISFIFLALFSGLVGFTRFSR